MRSDTMLSTKSLLARVEPTPDKCHPSWGACTARYPPHCYNKLAKLCEDEGDLKKSCRNAIDERTLAAETENLQSQGGHQGQTAIKRCQQEHYHLCRPVQPEFHLGDVFCLESEVEAARTGPGYSEVDHHVLPGDLPLLRKLKIYDGDFYDHVYADDGAEVGKDFNLSAAKGCTLTFSTLGDTVPSTNW